MKYNQDLSSHVPEEMMKNIPVNTYKNGKKGVLPEGVKIAIDKFRNKIIVNNKANIKKFIDEFFLTEKCKEISQYLQDSLK